MDGLSSSLGSPKFQDKSVNFWDTAPEPMQSGVDNTYPKTQSKPGQYDDVLNDVAVKYPALAPHTKNAVVEDATPPKGQEDDQLETFPAWEEWNPHPGKTTIQLYKPYQSRTELREALAGDLIHISGSLDPKTGKPVDPNYYELKKQVKRSRSPQQVAIDYKAYKDEVKNGEKRSFSKWFENSRSEAYVRGRLFPDKNDEWAKWYEENPKLKDAVDKIGTYLRTGSK